MPTPVAVVTTVCDGTPYGLMAGSFVAVSLGPPVSLDPPLMGFFVAVSSMIRPRMAGAGSFAVNVLAAGQDRLCAPVRPVRRGQVRRGAVGALRPRPSPAAGAVLRLGCRAGETRPAGDHTLVVGRVAAVEEPGPRGKSPPVFHDRLPRALPAVG
ncbi:flavin reductase family protein [Streptomyces sp. NPDC047017]|uniref:flavin reductase family protein n=1 Tax=Streptomyces sp. NPDC047017 TaxID=3155024 RepID=UPI0033D810C2